MKQFKLIGDHDKAYLSQMQYEQCEKMLMKNLNSLKVMLLIKMKIRRIECK